MSKSRDAKQLNHVLMFEEAHEAMITLAILSRFLTRAELRKLERHFTKRVRAVVPKQTN